MIADGPLDRARASELTSPSEIVRTSAELEEALGPDGVFEQGDTAHRLIDAAVQAGAVAWAPDERRQLRRVISRWTSRLRHVGERIELPELMPFEGYLPSLLPLSGEEAVESAKRGEPIVARGIGDCDLRAFDGVRRLRIVDCVLTRCNLADIELPEARLLHTTFDSCEFDATMLGATVATSSIFKGGSLTGAQAPDATFCGSQFDEISISRANFERASFAASVFREVDAGEAAFGEALFDLATIESSDFQGADLHDVVFTGATVHATAFADADLRLALFSSADVRDSDFRGAHLQGATFATAVDVGRATFDAGAIEEASFSDVDEQALLAASD